QRSTLNAHYTSLPVIEGMWGLAERLGFTGGRVLELGAGIGHFASMQGASRGSSDWTLVEMDEISARILRQLHPQAEVHAQGLESLKLEPNGYDLMIGNVPFAKDGP